ncbi:hypothetical protein F5890DRAFT_1560173 [Lentinula detonsa]|uniref:Uncharacterized protein n=1 Tax=Lentinula detonsa TaxID=2804962 RepID=A0AA38ULT4_9AGAR|nr:hypothetical protein F5890DRAFT_1560173 [Lentinula detonsa]
MAPSSADTLKSLLKPQPAHASRDMPIEADSIHGRLPRSTKSAALEERVWLSQNNRPQGPGLKHTAEVSTESGNTLKKKTEIATSATRLVLTKQTPQSFLIPIDKKPPHQNVRSGRGKSVTTMSRAKQLYEKSAIVEQDAAEDEDEDEEDSEDGGDNRFLPNDSDDSGEKDDIDELKDLDEEDLTRERVKVVGKKGGYNKRGSLIQTVHGDDVDFIPPPSQPASLTNNNNSSYCSESEASSRVDLSMMPDNYDSEEDEPAPIAKQKVSKAHDAKYIAELPAIVPPPMETRLLYDVARRHAI